MSIHQAHRRRQLAAIAGRNIMAEAARISDRDGVSVDEAVAAVFQDAEVLERCHRVAGQPIPGMPESSIAVQNKS